MIGATTTRTSEPAGQALEHAIAWGVRLASGGATDADRRACEAWRRADPAHEDAWQQVQAVEQSVRGLPAAAPHLAFETLQRADLSRRQRGTRRRALQALGAGALTVGLGGWLAQALLQPQRERHATATGERRRVELADGSSLQLNTGSAAELRYSLLRRVIVLHAGEVFIDTGADAGSLAGRRPFWLETPGVRFEALGTRFGVRRLGTAPGPVDTLLQVDQGRVAVHAGAAAPAVIAGPGDRLHVRTDGAHIERMPDSGLAPGAWRDGMLIAKRMRLDAFAAELARYRERALRCDLAVAALRVSGVFQLDGPDPVGRALQALARTLPVRLADAADGAQVLAAA
jgi:transmembrane sensor